MLCGVHDPSNGNQEKPQLIYNSNPDFFMEIRLVFC